MGIPTPYMVTLFLGLSTLYRNVSHQEGRGFSSKYARRFRTRPAGNVWKSLIGWQLLIFHLESWSSMIWSCVCSPLASRRRIWRFLTADLISAKGYFPECSWKKKSELGCPSYFCPLDARFLYFGPEIRILRKKSPLEPDSQVRNRISSLKNLKLIF